MGVVVVAGVDSSILCKSSSNAATDSGRRSQQCVLKYLCEYRYDMIQYCCCCTTKVYIYHSATSRAQQQYTTAPTAVWAYDMDINGTRYCLLLTAVYPSRARAMVLCFYILLTDSIRRTRYDRVLS